MEKKLKMYTASFCPKCRQFHAWFPNEFEYVSVDNWDSEKIESERITALPTVELPSGKKMYAGAMNKKRLEDLINEYR